jgi:hypothetical protein
MNNPEDLKLPEWAQSLLFAMAVKKIRFKQDETALEILNFLMMSNPTHQVQILHLLLTITLGLNVPEAKLRSARQELTDETFAQLYSRYCSGFGSETAVFPASS